MHAVEVALEGIEVGGPESAVWGQPVVDLLPGPQTIQTALRSNRGFNEAGLAQHTQVLGYGGLRHAQLAFDFSYRLLGGDQKPEDGATVRFGNDFESGFHAFYIPLIEYTCQGI